MSQTLTRPSTGQTQPSPVCGHVRVRPRPCATSGTPSTPSSQPCSVQGMGRRGQGIPAAPQDFPGAAERPGASPTPRRLGGPLGESLLLKQSPTQRRATRESCRQVWPPLQNTGQQFKHRPHSQNTGLQLKKALRIHRNLGSHDLLKGINLLQHTPVFLTQRVLVTWQIDQTRHGRESSLAQPAFFLDRI